MFEVGQQVVCIKEAGDCYNGETGPKKGKIYTIRDISVVDGDTGLIFEEIKNIPTLYSNGTLECSFISEDFRPIVENNNFAEEVLEKAEKQHKEHELVKESL